MLNGIGPHTTKELTARLYSYVFEVELINWVPAGGIFQAVDGL